MLNWSAGDRSPKSFTIPIVPDSNVENTEYFVARISNVVGADIGFDRVLIQIDDDDSAPHPGNIKFRHSRLSTEEDAGVVVYEVVRTGGSAGSDSE